MEEVRTFCTILLQLALTTERKWLATDGLEVCLLLIRAFSKMSTKATNVDTCYEQASQHLMSVKYT